MSDEPGAAGDSADPGDPVAGIVASHLRDVPDFPEPGVVFKDITPLLADHAAFAAVVDAMAERFARGVDVVVGIEARGFVLGAPVAYRSGAGFVPVRKQGKLPGPTYAASYALEYGEATVELHQDALRPGQRVLVLDDVLATGGTAAATVSLVREAGAEVTGVAFLLELSFLSGRDRLAAADGAPRPQSLLTV